MPDPIAEDATFAGDWADKGLSRRTLLRVGSAVPVAGWALGGFGGAAWAAGLAPAAGANGSGKQYNGRYAIDSHRVVDGFFAWPRRRSNADVVIIVAEPADYSAARAAARGHSAAGRIAIVPDLAATYGSAAGGSHVDQVAALQSDKPRFAKLAGTSGRVIVTTV